MSKTEDSFILLNPRDLRGHVFTTFLAPDFEICAAATADKDLVKLCSAKDFSGLSLLAESVLVVSIGVSFEFLRPAWAAKFKAKNRDPRFIAYLLAKGLWSQPLVVVVCQVRVRLRRVPARWDELTELLQEQLDVPEPQRPSAELPDEPLVERDLLAQLLERLRPRRELWWLVVQGPELVRPERRHACPVADALPAHQRLLPADLLKPELLKELLKVPIKRQRLPAQLELELEQFVAMLEERAAELPLEERLEEPVRQHIAVGEGEWCVQLLDRQACELELVQLPEPPQVLLQELLQPLSLDQRGRVHAELVALEPPHAA